MSKKLKDISKTQNKSYVAKEFQSFKSDLTRYARNYFVDQNADFSEASLGGMFVELAAYVGDSMTFFLDHQFNELNPETAVQQQSILSHARNAGVKIRGASPASVELQIFIEVPATQNTQGEYVPAPTAMPIVLDGSTFTSTPGVVFSITDDVDFNEKGPDGEFIGDTVVSAVDSNGNPTAFILTKTVGAISGNVITQTFTVNASKPFRRIALANRDVSEILSVVDADENVYYEVDHLTQDTVFRKTKNLASDSVEVPSVLEVVSAARRFTTETNFNTSLTTLTFGGGDESVPDNDAIPDPSKLALPLYGRQTFSRFSIDPKKLTQTQTLGTAPANTTLVVTYRAGGGLNHNVDARTIRTPTNVRITFPNARSAVESGTVTRSIGCLNPNPASGGARKNTIDDVRQMIATSRYQQSRVVTTDDLIARIYSMPTNFGRVYRATSRKSSRNPLATELYILSQNSRGQLTTAPDTLKKNLKKYLNEFRLVSDAIDVLDGTVINYGIEYSVIATPEANKSVVTNAVQAAISSALNIKAYQMDQPLIEADIINAIINTTGVLSLNKLEIFNISGATGGRQYSNFNFDIQSNKFKGMIVGPPGSVFELKYTSSDIFGSVE